LAQAKSATLAAQGSDQARFTSSLPNLRQVTCGGFGGRGDLLGSLRSAMVLCKPDSRSQGAFSGLGQHQFNSPFTGYLDKHIQIVKTILEVRQKFKALF